MSDKEQAENRVEEEMDKVVITRAMVGICGMQVCAKKDALDEEILMVCNRENPSGTTNGWTEVVRHTRGADTELFYTENNLPVQCADYPDRAHFLVLC